MDIQAMRLRMLKRMLFPPEVCVTKGSIERLGCLDPARVLVVCGGSARRNGALEIVKAQLKSATAVEIIELPTGEPTASTIEKSRAQVTAFGPKWIVALGGGAVMDAAKFIWALYEYPNLDVSGATAVAVGPLRSKAQLIAIPTTAGSGSEASQAAVLVGKDGTKIPYVSQHWIPDIVILDPSLTVTLSREMTRASGFDALTHAVESATSSLANPFTRFLAASAIGLVFRHLPTAVESPENLGAREGMLEAAFTAGLCQSTTSTGSAHALSHAASKLHSASHGAATGFFLLPAMKWNVTKNPAVYDEIAAGCGLRNGAALVAAVEDLASRAGVPSNFMELLGRTLSTVEQQALADVAAKDVCVRTNACRMAAPDLAQLVAGIG